MPTSCSAINCTNRFKKGSGITFHRFPKNDERRKQWILVVRRSKWCPSPNTFLCSQHFKNDSFYVTNGRKCLKEDAIPSIFNFPEHLKKKDSARRVVLKRTYPFVDENTQRCMEYTSPHTEHNYSFINPGDKINSPTAKNCKMQKTLKSAKQNIRRKELSVMEKNKLLKMASYSGDNIFKILLATDCHLGYLENDPIRGEDSLNTFEEILNIAVEKEVDLILLGGDLFHENKPSRKVLHNCMKLLRKYCMGDRPIQFEFLSDQSENFKHSACPIVNFEDPNLNVSLPVFSIHGNHDDPAGAGCFCSLDVLSVSGLVNYFGKNTDLENINISPLMLQKGKTKLCLYGLGSIRDERLHRMFLNGKVSMLRPKENCDDWFNLLVLHQNRVKHGAKNYIPEQFLDDFLDLVFWGHEHECRIERELNEKQAFFVTQPGSSVATSLCHGEAVKKHVGLLQIRGKEFQIIKVPLQTVRPFYIKDVDLDETSLNLHSPDSQEKVTEYCNELVDQFLQKAEEDHSGHPKQPKQPLVRLRIFHPHTFEPFSVHRFGHSYVSKVANNKDIILFSRKKVERLKAGEIDNEILTTLLKQEGVEKKRVEDLVKSYFEQADDKNGLLVLSEIGVSSAVQEYVDKEVKEAIIALVDHQMKKTQAHLKGKVEDPDTIDDVLLKFKKERKQNSQNETTEFQVVMKNTHTTRVTANDSGDDVFDDEDIQYPEPPKRGRGRGRGSRGGRATRGKAAPAKASTSRRNMSHAATNEEENGTKRRRTNPRNASKQTNLSDFFNDNDTIIEDSDDDDLQVQSKRRKTAATRRNTSRARGVMYDFSD